MSDRPELTIKEAATACGVSTKTVRRRLDADKFPNARRLDGPAGTESGPWVIPVGDLIAAGLQPGKPSPPDAQSEPAPETVADLPASQTDELRRLETENADLLRRAEVAEAIAEERERTIEAQAQALRMLEAGPTADSSPLKSSERSPDGDEQGSSPSKRAEAGSDTPTETTEARRGRVRRWFFGE